jgi:hypothetical protein
MRQHKWLAALAVVAAAHFCPVVYAGTFATITIDDDYSDWAGIPVLDSDGGDNAGGPDIGDTQIANDDDYLYIRNTFPNSLSLSTYIALDVDNNPATGYDIFSLGLVGSEAGWQNDFAFSQSTGVFNSGSLSGDFFGGGHALLSPFADAPSRELAISLDALFASDNSPVFPDDTITLMLWTDGGSGDVSAVINYTLAVVPECTSLVLMSLAAIGLAWQRRRPFRA